MLAKGKFRLSLTHPRKSEASLLDCRVNLHDIIPNRASSNALLRAHGLKRGEDRNEE